MGTDEWVAELYKEFPKFYMERSKRYGNNYTVTVISHFFIDNDDGETYTLGFYVKVLNNDTGEEVKKSYFMQELLLEHSKLTWEEKFTHSNFMYFPRKREGKRETWSNCVIDDGKVISGKLKLVNSHK